MGADEFRQARLAMGLSTAQLAAHFGIAKRTIERIEHSEGSTVVMSFAMERLAQIVTPNNIGGMKP